MRFLLAILLLTGGFLAPAAAQDQANVVFVNSDPVVAVHSNFRGQAVTLFGNIEPLEGGPQGPFSVIVLVQGPASDWVVREKERQLGLVLNSTDAHYGRVPSYYAILSSAPLAQIADPDIVEQQRLSFTTMAHAARQEGDSELDSEFVRLMRQAGHFIEGERSVVMHSATAFSVSVPLASDAANGLYLARAIVLAEGKVVAEVTTRFTVRTQGFERYLATSARTTPALYGLAAILLALGTGWLGGVLFRR